MTKVISVNSNIGTVYSQFVKQPQKNEDKVSSVQKKEAQPEKNNLTDMNIVLGVMAGVGVATVGAAYLRGVYLQKTFDKLKKEAVELDIPFIKGLAHDMTQALGIKVEPDALKSVMGKNELSFRLKSFEPQNFVAYAEDVSSGVYKRNYSENFRNGLFKIDIHSHTNFSDGVGNVADILEDAAIYADELYSKTGEKFIFAITDHDAIGGTKEALKLIAQNPSKYKNLRFVPGVELSFAHPTDKGTAEVSEMLAYGVNPYSQKFNSFLEKTIQNRRKMIDTTLEELSAKMPDVGFDKSELQGFFFDLNSDLFKYSLHWRLYNYAQIKQRLSGLAKQWGKDPKAIYREIMPQWHVAQHEKSPELFEQFMASRSVDLTKTKKEDGIVTQVFQKIIPSLKDDRVVAPGERSISELVNYCAEDKNILLSLAHPAFYAKHFSDFKKGFDLLFAKTGNLLESAELAHQAYSIPIQKGAITEDFVESVNNFLRKKNLLVSGGHDNHSANLLTI